MSDVWASPSDPVFWMHHSFIDHSWWQWQTLGSSRVSTIDGTDTHGNTITMDTIIQMGGIRPDVPVSAIVNTLGGVSIGGVPFCYRYSY
jgi:tyrosinase